MKLRTTIAQFDVAWEDKAQNLSKIKSISSELSGKTDLIILPEMCTTGFSMNTTKLSETNDGESVSTLKECSAKYGMAICGSFMAKEGNSYYNRGFFISPDQCHFYDKRHLFRMGEESEYYSQGNNKLIVEHKGLKICLLICYDLRFPVWARNCNNEYDLLIYTANWPASRIKAWNTLLTARAIENMSYVCGVNRIGKDGIGITYNGCSVLLDAKGNVLSSSKVGEEQIETIELNTDDLYSFREKFPAWKDADTFEIKD